MPGQIVHLEIPADDTAQAREFWGSLFGWQFENYPAPSEYHMTRLAEQQGDREDVLSNVAAGRPLGRLADASEVASVVVFLCSERASYVTGAAWSADGGTVPIIL